jgi:hypothetical protein
MDSAVWGVQAVVDQRRRDREADAAACRQARAAVRGNEASGRRARPSRWQRRFTPAVAVVPEPAGDDLELVGAGDSR